jgi:hypothetical protein
MSQLTTSHEHNLRVGETFSMPLWVPDKRRWPRFVAWLLRRPAPRVCQTRYFKVTEIVTSTAFKFEDDK